MPAVADAFLDLVLGVGCVVCARPGRPLCRPCRAGLPCDPAPRPPRQWAAHLPPPYAAGPYGTSLRPLVVAHKERGVLSLASPLGLLLAVVVVRLLHDAEVSGHRVLLVPVPSRAASVRERGHDPTAALARRAAHALRRHGVDAHVAPLLRLRPGVVDQAGLDAHARAANLADAMAVDPGALRRARRRHPRAHLVVCDDVVTTGATLMEADRALTAVGLAPLGHAAVAATERRRSTARS